MCARYWHGERRDRMAEAATHPDTRAVILRPGHLNKEGVNMKICRHLFMKVSFVHELLNRKKLSIRSGANRKN
uniref:Uncharacterized protein n=1 Tax=Strigamia maritima TaxID=126957 RepID=T1JM17_STRMM